MRNKLLGGSLIVLAIGVMLLGFVKVDNELQMTKAYDRQAAALERIADAGERAQPKPVEIAARPTGPAPCTKTVKMTNVYYRDKDMGPTPIGFKVAHVESNADTLKAWGKKNPTAEIFDVQFGEVCK